MASSGVVSGSPSCAGRLSPATTNVKFADELAASGGAPVGNCVIAGKVCPNADAATNRITTQIFCIPQVSHEIGIIRAPEFSSGTLPLAAEFQHRGAVAQLGERLNRTQEVIGSIPFSSAKIDIPNAAARPRFSLAHPAGREGRKV